MTLVIKARIEREFNLLEKEDDAFYERRFAEAKEAEAKEAEAKCECRSCMLKAYAHLDTEEVQPQNPIESHDVASKPCETSSESREEEFDESTCNECGGYYKDHRICHGMTQEEIAYEDYVAEWTGPGCFGRY